MADNTTLNSGTGGDIIATDDITDAGVANGAKVQRIKIGYGADNAYSEVTSTATNPFPVALSDTDNAVLDTIETNTDFGTVTGGGVEATALRVTLASDSTGQVTVDGTVTANAGTGTMTVDNGGTFAVQAAVDELPAAAALTDAFANPTTTQVGSMNMVYNGTTWDFLREGGEAGSILVDLGANNDVTVTGTVDLGATDNAVLDQIEVNTSYGDNTGNGTAAGSLRVSIASDSTGQVALAAGSNSIGTLGANSGVDIGDVDVTSISAGSNLIGDVGLSGARTSGGTTPYYNNGVATETQIKGSGGQVYWISAVNVSSSVRYLQMFNNLAASVTPGTTTPTNEWPIPTQGDTNGAGLVISIPNGLAYGTGITFFISTAKGGGSAATADDVLLNLGYA